MPDHAKTPLPAALPVQAPALLEVVQAHSGQSLVVQSADGQARLRVTLADGELVVECLGGRTRLHATGALALSADTLALEARGSMQLCAGGDLQVRAGGRVDLQAGELSLEATRGDALLTANDDVRIEGERIRMNA